MFNSSETQSSYYPISEPHLDCVHPQYQRPEGRTCSRQRPIAGSVAFPPLPVATAAEPAIPVGGAANAKEAAERGMSAVEGIVYSPCTSYRLRACCRTTRSRRSTSLSHRRAPERLSPCALRHASHEGVDENAWSISLQERLRCQSVRLQLK